MSDTENEPTQPSKQDIIQNIGNALAERRKVRGISIDKIAQSLKIRAQYLKALEKGDWSELPGEVYAKGFLKRYAQYLGLDGEKLLAPYIAERPSHHDEENQVGASNNPDISRGLLIGIGIAAIFVIVLFKLVSQDQNRMTEPVETVPVETTDVAVASKPSPVPSVEPIIDGMDIQHKLEVQSPFPLWLRVTAEDRNFEGFITQGSTWIWSAKGKFSIRLGHSRQITMMFDGQPVELQENQKRVELP